MLYNENNLKDLQDERLRLLCELRQLEDAEKVKVAEETSKKSEALQAPPTLICLKGGIHFHIDPPFFVLKDVSTCLLTLICLKGCTPSVLHDAIPPSPSTHTHTHTGPCSH